LRAGAGDAEKEEECSEQAEGRCCFALHFGPTVVRTV
jgi:hypothetical protein